MLATPHLRPPISDCRRAQHPSLIASLHPAALQKYASLPRDNLTLRFQPFGTPAKAARNVAVKCYCNSAGPPTAEFSALTFRPKISCHIVSCCFLSTLSYRACGCYHARSCIISNLCISEPTESTSRRQNIAIRIPTTAAAHFLFAILLVCIADACCFTLHPQRASGSHYT